MDTRRLEVFCKVLELKSFTKAAEALSLSQPTVSDHIRCLEEALGERLVDRTGRAALPTPVGSVFHEYATKLILLHREAVEAVTAFRGNLVGSLTLGASTIPGTYILPKLIGEFKKQHPGITITLRIRDSAETVGDVLDGNVSAGWIGARFSDRRLVLEESFSDELVLVVRSEHKWAKKGVIKLNDLAQEPFICRERGSGTRVFTSGVLEAHGLDPSRLSIVAEMGSTEAVRQGVKAGIGVSILSRQAVKDDIESGLFAEVRVTDLRFSRPLYLIRRRGRHLPPVCDAFLNFVQGDAKATP